MYYKWRHLDGGSFFKPSKNIDGDRFSGIGEYKVRGIGVEPIHNRFRLICGDTYKMPWKFTSHTAIIQQKRRKSSEIALKTLKTSGFLTQYEKKSQNSVFHASNAFIHALTTNGPSKNSINSSPNAINEKKIKSYIFTATLFLAHQYVFVGHLTLHV